MKRNQLISITALAGGTLAAAAYCIKLIGKRRHPAYTFVGKAVIITGGSRGLGLVLARMLIEEGARVTLIARDTAELERAQQDLIKRGAAPDQVSVVSADVRDPGSIQAAIKKAHKTLGGIDVLINGAGIISAGPLQHMQTADYENAMATHFWGAWHTSHAVLPFMRQQKQGRIVNIASLAGKIALPHMGPYSASKAALVSLSESMRIELARENISVTTICPGPMRTGAHVNAKYKGRHREEYTGLTLLSSLPWVSTDARIAARKIIEACRNDEATIVFPRLFNLLPVLNQIRPDIASRILSLVNQWEPSPTSRKGDVLKEGWDSLSPLAPSALTVMGDLATAENNGLRGHAPLVIGDGNAK